MDKPMIDVMWVAICAVLVFLMQGGFLCLEAGLCRSKNYINVAVKNVLDMGIAVLMYWAMGYALMFGTSAMGLVGTTDFFRNNNGGDFWGAVFFVFQAMFCGTAVTILSGAIAERMRITAYFWGVVVVAGIIYPIMGHWVWGGLYEGVPAGWLARLGFVDFAGSTVVHSTGGWVALAALLMVGPRMGRFPADGPPQEIPGADIPLATFGVLVLWFGWFGFNGGSTLEFSILVPKVITNTLLAAAAGVVSSVGWSVLLQNRVDITWAMNGVLAGAVGITANCHAVSAPVAVIIGGLAGLVCVGATRLLEHLRIDDVVGAVPVHLACGIWGTLAVGLFGDLEVLGTGLTRWQQIRVQLLGIGTCAAWSFLTALATFVIIGKFSGLRVKPEDEQVGLNISEHGARTETHDFFMVMDRQIKTGDLTLRVPVDPFTEVGRIAANYNRVMEKLEQSTAQTDAVIRSALDPIITVSKATYSVLGINPAAERLLKISATDAVGRSIASLMLLEDEARGGEEVAISALLEQLATTQAKPELLARCSGASIPVQLVVTESAAAGESFYTLTVRDNTERRAADADLHIARDQNEALLGDVEEGVVNIDERGRIATINRGARRLLGVAQEGDAIGQPAHLVLFPLEIQERVLMGIRRLLATRDDPALGVPIKTELAAARGRQVTVELVLRRFQQGPKVTILLLFRQWRDREGATVTPLPF